MKHTIPAQRPHFSKEDRHSILANIDECLRDGQVGPGKYVEEFENSFAAYSGTGYASAVSSGGSALEVSMRALNVRDGDVLVPTNTFMATAAAVLAAGGHVRLMVADAHSSCH